MSGILLLAATHNSVSLGDNFWIRKNHLVVKFQGKKFFSDETIDWRYEQFFS